MNHCIRTAFFSVLVCLTLTIHAQNPAEHFMQSSAPVHPGKYTDGQMKVSDDNYFTFPQRKKAENPDAWIKYNGKKDLNHPEFGVLPDGAPCDSCVEVYAERKADRRFFRSLKDSTLQYIQQSLGSLNALSGNHWVSIRHKLEPAGGGIYRSGYAQEPAIIDVNRHEISLQTVAGDVRFNDWTLLVRRNGLTETIGAANWSRYTIGEDGMYVTGIFEGIDAELKIYRGAIKTNFIIRRNAFGQFDELIFRDAFNQGRNTRMKFTESDEQKGTGQLTVFLNGVDALKVNEGYAYAKNGGKESLTPVSYDISNGALDVVVPGYWIRNYIGQHELVVDPLVTASNTLAQASITGSAYSAACFTNYCSYNLTVARPAGFNIVDANWSFTYVASGACWLWDGAVTFNIGGCNSPSAAGYYWFCNGIGTGNCNANNISIFNDISSCLPAPSCAATNIGFQMRFYRCYSNSAGCSGSCIGAASPWTMTLIGRTVELASPVTVTPVTGSNVCQGGNATLSATAAHGTPPYFYSWSADPGGVPVLAIGASPVVVFPNAGSTPVYLTITDACGNINNSTVNVNVTPQPVVTLTPAANPICNGQNPDIALSSTSGGTTYTWSANATGVAGSSAGSGAGPISQILNVTGSNPGTVVYEVTGNAGGCTSAPVSQTITVNPAISATQTLNICSNQLPYTWNGQNIATGGNGVATFTTSSIVTGCDSTTTLNLIVNPLIYETEDLTICSNQLPYTWNGQNITTAGNGVATFVTPSLTTGCDSITTLNLAVIPAKTADENLVICSNELPFSWNGQTVTAGGTAVAAFTMPSIENGCDSITTLNLTVNPVKTATENITICAGLLPYTWNGQTISTGGTAVATFTMPSTENGCDSITTLNLTVNPLPVVAETITVCADDLPYTWNGQTITAGGNNVASFVTPSLITGCDSTTTLNLIVNPLINEAETITICVDALPYTWNGQTIAAGGNNVASFVTPSLITGCDSTTTLNLFVNPLINETETITICADALPYTWNGQTIAAGGNNVATFTTPSMITGCDSTTTLNLIVNPLINEAETITICADALPYTWNGQTIAGGGNNIATFTTPSLITGCDSTIILNLIVNPLINETETISICANLLPYTWNGQSITAGGNAVAVFTTPSLITGCDSTTTLNLLIETAPVIGTQPAASVIFINDNTSFTVSASGTSPLTYQWEVNEGSGFVPVTDGPVYSGSQSPTLTLTNTPLSLNGHLYRCVVRGVCQPDAVSVSALLTVNKHPQTLTFQAQTTGSTVTIIYGDAAPDGSATASSGLTVVYSSSNTSVASINTAGQIAIHGTGSTIITAAQAGDGTYLPASSITFTLQVNRKNLLVTADDKSRPFGENNPPLTLSYSGFVYGENESVITVPAANTPAVLTSMPGQYPIFVTGGAAANYNLVFVTGTLHITGAIVHIRQHPAPQAVCENEDADFTVVAEAQSPVVTLQYQWQQSDNSTNWTDIAGANTSALTLTAISSTYIRCMVSAPGTILSSQATTFTVHPLPLVRVSKSNDLDCNYGSTQLVASGALQYNWTPPTGLSNTSIANPVARPTLETKYYVTGTDVNGCVNRDSVIVEILNTRHGDNLVANAFTPNSDGRNDCFGISYWGVVEKIDFSIYNRAGVRVFYSRDPYGCWNGRYQGAEQPAGVYVYYIKAVTNCGPIERKGTVMLIR